MTAARGISRDAKYAGCFLCYFLSRRKKVDSKKLKSINAPNQRNEHRQQKIPVQTSGEIFLTF